jgi:phage terminase large subunit-like protein
LSAVPTPQPFWDTACKDWEQRLLSRQGLITFPPLFQTEADNALRILNELRIVDVPGSPTFGEAARPWVSEFAASIFGAYDPKSHRRLITEFFLCVSKKNSKSTLAAGIMLTALLCNWRKSAEFLILAPTIEIANNSFYPARDMVRADEELSDLLHVQDHLRTITHRTNGATLKVVAADNETVGGKKATGVLIDELWLFGKRPNAENMIREATGGLASRPEGFTIFLSTQSDDPPVGVFRQKLQYARGVRDGRIHDPRFLPVIYEFPQSVLEAGGHKDPENFFVTNPNLGASVDEAFLSRELQKAENDGDESMRGFLAKHLNVEIGIALKSDRWAGADFWEMEKPAPLSLEDLLARSEVVTIGIDGGGLDDMLGLAVLGRDKAGNWLLWTHAWIHPIVLERRKSEASKFKDFERQADLTIVENIGDDVMGVYDVVEQVEASKLLYKVGVDVAGIGAISDALTGKTEGDKALLKPDRVVGIPQGWRMVGAIKTLERKLAERGVIHGSQPMMAWVVGNAKIEQRGNNILLTKQAAGTAKIDPLLATLDAVQLMAYDNPKPQKKAHQMFTLG